MSYFNQPDHQLLDRKLVLTPLYELMNGEVQISPTRLERSDQLAELKAQCDSELERTWLDFLNERNLRLPDSAQRLIEQCNTRCDFYYSAKAVAVYIDGPPHDYNNVAVADSEVNDCLTLDLGLTVLRFRHDQRARWEEIVADHASVFGKVHG
jgi:very-short-patch-repair endonuclease